jgi:bifunctional UDP-N-acetylglucosamine pyrophosphorylase / glucosamine-1-phosphate N-acetyltransferase
LSQRRGARFDRDFSAAARSDITLSQGPDQENVLTGERTCLAVVLAAGEGTRMRSAKAKVLHSLGGKSLIANTLAAVREAGGTNVAVVVGPEADGVIGEAKRALPDAEIFVQHPRRGTAHAVLAAREAIGRGADDVLIVFADTPLIRPQTLRRMREALAKGVDLVVLGFRAKDPTGYGRLIFENGELVAIREELDASAAEREINLCNAGLMAISGRSALAILDRVDNANRKGEFYLTDTVSIVRAMGRQATVIEGEEEEVQGINTKAQLAQSETVLQQRLRRAAMDAGVTLVAPETVYLSSDTSFGRDVVVEPFVVFGPGVTVEDNAVIRSFSHLHGAHVGKGALVGPYARLRPGATLQDDVHIGNFVEVKEAIIETGAKANHLSYIGDATIGAGANVGAGTITCNYDGVAKHRTEIGKKAFIGSNSALVAPVKVGDGAYIGSGSVITQDVPADALAVARGRQTVKEGWARRQREKAVAKKKTP